MRTRDLCPINLEHYTNEPLPLSWDRSKDTTRGTNNHTSFLDIEDMLFEVRRSILSYSQSTTKQLSLSRPIYYRIQYTHSLSLFSLYCGYFLPFDPVACVLLTSNGIVINHYIYLLGMSALLRHFCQDNKLTCDAVSRLFKMVTRFRVKQRRCDENSRQI